MAFSDEQKAFIRELAFEVGGEIKTQLQEDFAKSIRLHQAECPMKIEVTAKLNEVRGAGWLGGKLVAIVGGLLGFAGACVALWQAFRH